MIYLLLALALLLAFVAFIYNSLVRSKNRCEAAWSDIDAQLKRRYDLIPNLVETVKGYAKHEAGTLEKITKARTDAMNAQGMHDKEAAENMLSSALKSIFALAENYPDLKANQNFLDLQKNLSEIEDAIQNSRRFYNATVKDFNTKIQVFPNNLLAGMMKFIEREFFQASEEEKKNVKVDFGTKEAATADAPKEAPAAETPKEAPAAEAPKEAPAAETPKEAPAAEAPKEAPAAETPKEAPAAEAPKEDPKA